MNYVLNDPSVFRKVSVDPMKNNWLLEDKLNRFLRKLKNNNNITECEYKELYATGTNPGVMYGLPKIHKPNIPLRPVLSAYKTHNFKLAKYIIPQIQKYAKNEYTLSNSYEFFEQLRSLQLEGNNFMVSLDISSLYTNVPKNETISILTSKIYENGESFGNLSENEFRKMMNLAVNDTYFIFNNQYYEQTDGLAMGSPLSATLANIFLCHFEKEWLENCPVEFKPKFYRRYVDDTFLIFDNENQANLFQTYMNSRHQKINFTIETEENSKLPFLDILISRNNTDITMTVYRKPTYTGLGVNFISSCFRNFKLNTFNMLFYRAFRLTSTYKLFHDEIMYLKTFFNENGFTDTLFFKKLRKFLDRIFSPPAKAIGPKKMKLFFKFPFLRDNTNEFLKKEITFILNKYFPQIDPSIIFYNNFKIKNFINHKEKLLHSFESGIVYKFECSKCHLVYVGSTIKTLHSRFLDHKGVSGRTGRPLQSPLFSSIRDHCHGTCDNNFKVDDFKILYKGNFEHEIRLSESIFIRKIKPALNSDSASSPLYF